MSHESENEVPSDEELAQGIENAANALQKLAEGIKTISETMRKIGASPIKREQLLKIIQLNTKPRMGIGEIENVIDSIETLDSNFLKN